MLETKFVCATCCLTKYKGKCVYTCSGRPHSRAGSKEAVIKRGDKRWVIQIGKSGHTFRQSLLKEIHGVSLSCITQVIIVWRMKTDLEREVIQPTFSALHTWLMGCVKWAGCHLSFFFLQVILWYSVSCQNDHDYDQQQKKLLLPWIFMCFALIRTTGNRFLGFSVLLKSR